MTDEVLDIMQPGNVVTDEQLAMIDSNADLREACQDVMMIKGILAEQSDAEKALHKLQQRHRARRRNLYWTAGLAAAALFAGALFLLWPARHTTEENLLAQQAELAQQASASDMADEVVITSSDSLSQSVSRIVAETSSADTPSLPDEVVNVGGGTTASEQVVTSTLTVPYGHSVLVKLSDGTRVYLRPGSKLIYPEAFVGDHRIVSLKGEAYFCVAHRPNQPFIVGTKHGIVSDYGTEFNIDTQADKTEVRARLLQLLQERGLSPSSLSTYINCPLKYYLKYIEQIKDDSIEEDVGRDVVGRVIHKTLELLFGDYLPLDGKLQVIDKALFDKQIHPQWKSKLYQAIAEEYPNGFPDVGFNYLNKVNIEQQLGNYFNYTSKQLENSNLTIISTEEELRFQLQSPECLTLFHGFADRIDQFGGLTRVIDYKTGKVDIANLKLPLRYQSDSDLDYLKQIPEKALQLLLYKYLFLKMHPEMQPEQVTGAIHGLKYVKGIEFCLTKATPSSKDSDVDSNFLEDSSFIGDMEAMLKAVVNEMLDESQPFVQAVDDDHCGYCEFRLICKR